MCEKRGTFAGAGAQGSEIDGTGVVPFGGGAAALFDRAKPEDRHIDRQLHGMRFTELLPFDVPSSAFEKEPSDVDAFIWRRLDVLRDRDVEDQGVDGEAVETRGGLENGSEEAVGIGKGREPVDRRLDTATPLGKLFQTEKEIARPRRQRLEGRIGTTPCRRHTAVTQGGVDLIEIGTHHDPALNSAQQLRTGMPYSREQDVITLGVLLQHDVQRRGVIGMPLTDAIQIERRREKLEYALGGLFHRWPRRRRRRAVTSCGRLKTDKSIDEGLAFFAEIRDLCIGMLTESFGRVRQGKGLDIRQRAVHGGVLRDAVEIEIGQRVT